MHTCQGLIYDKPQRRFAPCRLDGPVVVGNVGDNSVSSYQLHASETQQPATPTPRHTHLLPVGSCYETVVNQ